MAMDPGRATRDGSVRSHGTTGTAHRDRWKATHQILHVHPAAITQLLCDAGLCIPPEETELDLCAWPHSELYLRPAFLPPLPSTGRVSPADSPVAALGLTLPCTAAERGRCPSLSRQHLGEM